ncbi:MAG: hypothetical protein GX216_01100 [Methanomicrobiales archaeon]|nr:hypothetical protein [Methanomicrobiales archaeon]
MRGMDLKKHLKLPAVNVDKRDLLIAVLAVMAVISIAFCGWTLLADYAERDRITEFSNHVAESEADLFVLSEEISAHMQSRQDYPMIAEYDAWMKKLGALADYGRDLTLYHRYVIAADEVPEAYAGAQDAYVRALDSLNRAFSLWSSGAGAYGAKVYSAADANFAGADRAWKDYIAALSDYEQELLRAEVGAEEEEGGEG